MMNNLVFLDSHALNPGDLSWEALTRQGRLTVWSAVAMPT